ncbi:TonB-dependent receptor [Microbulbifer spongiae]|uniref:TonB-dependent receptor n=1 Tax=Microbulbifer spongiae TaxID=2944933 RepID=A0ABY9EE53_9GAMM|nr:TonB-dependent receptor [Microbulbifer sp. MI-G]WKD49026.1 TonB-dependent receptor [Microbulbifer sp. MI-G]
MPSQIIRRLLSSVVLAIIALSAAAQENLILEEVVVTAQKRKQSVQEVPIAISTFDKTAIQHRRISNITDISLSAPNVEIVDSPANTTAATIAIRGASQISPAITWENSVGIYLDGVFMGKNLGAVFDIVELERVEVLRGPQGTLYGKNTVGGAVNLITRKPGDEFSGSLIAELGSAGYWSGRATINTPDWKGLKSSLTLFKAERDGFSGNRPDEFDNPLAAPPSSHEFQNLDEQAARLALQWDTSENLGVSYTFDYSDQDNKPRFGQLTQISSNSYLYSGIQEPYLTRDDERADKGSNDWAIEEASESTGHALDIQWQGDNTTLRSITAYRELDWNDTIDIDGTAIDIFHSSRYVNYDAFSQELQLSGNLDQLDYVVGAYYFEEDADVLNPITFFGAFGNPTSHNRYGLDTNSVALYGQLDWRPAIYDDRLTVTAGLRWTEEKKDQYIIHPSIFTAQASDTFDNTSPSIALNWSFTDDINVYLRHAKGWKSGGFNGEAALPAEFYQGYKDEQVTSYETGLKSMLLNGRLRLNGAVFYNEFDNFQLSVFEGEFAASVIFNVPKYETKGVEIEAIALVNEGLQLTASYGYLNAQYKKFPNNFTYFNKEDAGTPYSPKNSLTLGMDWRIDQKTFGLWDLHIEYSYRDDYVPFIDPDQNAASAINDRTLLNARLAFDEIKLGNSGTLLIALWGQNLTDEDYRINTIPFGGVDQRIDPNSGSGVGWTTSYFGDPRTYGIETRYSF